MWNVKKWRIALDIRFHQTYVQPAWIIRHVTTAVDMPEELVGTLDDGDYLYACDRTAKKHDEQLANEVERLKAEVYEPMANIGYVNSVRVTEDV